MTTVASNGEVKPERTFEAAVVGRDAVTMLSLTAIDLPVRQSVRCGQYISMAIVNMSFHTRLSSIGFRISGLVNGIKLTGLLLRAHMVLVSPCAQEESVPRPMYTRAHHMLLLVW